MENGWDNTKQAKMPYFHCGPSVKIADDTGFVKKMIVK